jgi:large subunit ribosomal protein L15
MKIHELHPAPGSNRPRTRVGRGIAAGKGKTAGRGTKGQKARAGGSIPPWFEGGQTPLHMRIPKLRGFKPRFSLEYEVVNVGAIASLVELGAFESGEAGGGKSKAKSAAPITVNQDILRGVGLVRTLNKPLKILGTGELSTALFVVADAFSKSAIAKIEGAGGSVSVLEVPTVSRPALGVESGRVSKAAGVSEESAETVEAPVASPAASTEKAPAEEAKAPRRSRARAATGEPADSESAESAPAESQPGDSEPAQAPETDAVGWVSDESPETSEDGA